jgi:hypothetical protein
MSKIKTVEEMTERINNADNLASKCRLKIGVLMEYFDLLSYEETGREIADPVAWARGIKEMCADMVDELSEAGALISRMDDDLKVYSIDIDKVKKENQYRKSIGIHDPLEVPEVPA